MRSLSHLAVFLSMALFGSLALGCATNTDGDQAAEADNDITQTQSERTLAMDALRATLRPVLKNQDIVFNVSQGKYAAKDGWVFMFGKIELRGSQKPVDYRGTQYEDDIRDGLFDDNFSALLHKENGKLVVKTWVIGSTDVPWENWPQEHGAPPEIFR
jgi:hypothetical protein